MKKSYQVKVIAGAGEPRVVDIATSTGANATTLNPVPGARYQLIDTATGLAPDNIRVNRKGKDVRVYFDGREQADLVIADYYNAASTDSNTLIGESQSGVYHPYIPESAEWGLTVNQMTDGASPIGMALGSESVALADFSPAGLPIVATAAGINPLWGAPLLLVGAGGGGGGGGGSQATPDTTPPTTPTAAPASFVDNVGPITSATSTSSVTDDTTPGINIGALPAGSTDAVLYVDGVKVAATYDPATGTLTPKAPLGIGPHSLTYSLIDAAGNESGQSPALNVTVDTAAPDAPTGALYGADDLGLSATDNLTSDNTPRISGSAEPNASVKITINGHDYVGQADALGRYLIQVTDALPNTLQNYKVQATDAAGNATTADGTPFTVDASSVSTSQGVGLSIDAITQDTGLSQTDFVTGDNTLTWKGKLIESGSAVFNADDLVQVQLVNAQTQVVATKYIQPSLTAGVWNWTWPDTALPLADGEYTLKAQLVDTAGNVLSAPWAWTQNATIDTQPQQLNGAHDPNADFNVQTNRLVQDPGLSTTDFVTNATQLSFTGNVTAPLNHSTFNASTGRVLAEVIDNSGKVLALQYLTPSATGDWTFDNTAFSLGVANAVTTYTLKTSTVDMAGHCMNASSQAFTIDLQKPVVSNPGRVIVSGGNDYDQMSFSADEKGVYIFNTHLQTGSTLDLGGLTHFAAGEFNMVFRDTAGNERTITNTQVWDFHLTQPITLAMASTGPGGFDNGQLVGSVGPVSGKYVMTPDQNLDLSSLYSLSPALQATGGINHIVMGTGAQTLTVSIGNVLELGISNSFSNATAFRDHLQMRVDGDSADKLNLTKQWANSTDQSWLLNPVPATLDAQTYNVYYNETLKLDLFVQSAIHVTVL